MIDRISCPIGMPEITGKEPPVIAVGVACELVLRMQQQAEPGRRGRAGDVTVQRRRDHRRHFNQ